MMKVKSDILSEGEDIIGTCSAPEETGTLIFSFYENDLDVKRVVSSSNSATTTLTTQKNTEIYLQCAYMVMMRPNAGLSKKSNVVKVIVRGNGLLIAWNLQLTFKECHLCSLWATTKKSLSMESCH